MLYKPTFIVYVSILLFIEGGHFTLMPIMLARMFGDHAATVYGFGFSFAGLANIISLTLTTFVFHDHIEACYYIAAAFSVVSLILLIVLFVEKKVV